jgi:O-methyltransferase
MTTARDLYFDLLKKALCFFLWEDRAAARIRDPKHPLKKALLKSLNSLLGRRGMQLARASTFSPEARENGLDWAPMADTMIGLKRLDNIQSCIETVLRNNVPGDLIETGVWRGGATIFMRAVLKAYDVSDRVVWVADSFEGLPEPDDEKYPVDKGSKFHLFDVLHVSLDQVKDNFSRYGMLDEQVKFLQGWFKDTLPDAPIRRLAILRLDGDMYESTMDAMKSLYPKVSKGGFVIVDDYGIEACRKAISDYRLEHSISAPILEIDKANSVYWQVI